MNVVKTFKNKSSTDLTGKEGYVVIFDTDGINVASAITNPAIGIVTRGGVTNSEVCIFGECTALCGATVTAGQAIIPHTDGTVKDTASTGVRFGMALESGVAGDWANVFVRGSEITAA
ncbi:MAG: hypothetical protein ACOYOU_08115 [Kiritimatiellia bacterium]